MHGALEKDSHAGHGFQITHYGARNAVAYGVGFGREALHHD